ncbi:PDDEXK nuclease domain-containing protein [Sansalvadorimonas verongulae]|uniref:PDDEXK nuclease domain-containing protein n=1 Tax=Sansalvadorimonas verongulae TaxID=2172824 RepID=UPI0012BBE6C6|nr:PDDEXK nuclease domain-containing protein [Sansalvadorimonas verongulae]MTI14082.1 DUF1016 domain-containing protein [Sansalvadorimonas verongulae]
MSKTPQSADTPDALFGEIKDLIQSAKQRAAVAVNAELTLLYWQVGQRINTEVLKGERADYGKQVIANLSKQLTGAFGRGWGQKQLLHCCRFAEVYADQEIVSTLSRQLHWSHFLELIYHKEPLARDFYVQMCALERWSVRTLRKQVNSMLFERTAVSKKPEKLLEEKIQALRNNGQMDQDLVLKDPYFLDFLQLTDRYVERDLEDAILREMEHFLLELGAGFTFVARQKRIQIDNDDFYLDLLFYNRILNRLVAIELKTEKFRHSHKSQMELYLRWLDKHDRQLHENPPIGIILCASKKQEQIELLGLDKGEIHVAEYLTKLPSHESLEARFQQAIHNARKRIENKGEE